MKRIQNLIDEICDEIDGAKNYAESYLDCKAKGNGTWSTRYKEMAQDELKHFNYLHEKIVVEIEELSRVYKPPVEMQDLWEEEHRKMIEEVAFIKTMLAM